MRRVLAIVFALALFGVLGASVAVAEHKNGDNACPPASPKGGGDPSCGRPSAHPTCKDGIDNDHDGKKDRADSECRDPDDGVEDGSDQPTCPPATGDISGGVIQPLSDAIRDGGGAALADLIDQINCRLVQGTLGL